MHQVQLVNVLPAFFLFDTCKLGSFTLTTPKERYLLNEYAIEIEKEIESPGHHFSALCKDYSFVKRTPDEYSMLSYPFKAIPGKCAYGFYVDISKAYATISETFGMECSFREQRYFAFGRTRLHPAFFEHKILRALIVSGTSKQNKFQEWKNHELINRQFPNRNYAPHIRLAVFSMLHAIQVLVDRHTIYAHTDGFIVPAYRFAAVTKLLEERHIPYTIKNEGYCQIYNVGCYRFGSEKFEKVWNRTTHTKSNLRDTNAEWWLRQWERGLDLRGG